MNQELYKLIIADDEKTIRDALSKFINWNELGFEVVGCFDDGDTALDFLEKSDVDAVLTDIKMARVTGLDIARYIHVNKRREKVVLLTGYKDFEYARSAIEFDVAYYLLKPTQLPELYDVFRKVKEQLRMEKRESVNLQLLRETLREQFFLNIFWGSFYDRKDIEEKAAQFQFDVNLEKMFCAVLSVKLDDYASYMENKYMFGKEQLYISVRNFFKLAFQEVEFVPIYQAEGNLKYIVYSKNVLCRMDDLENVEMELYNVMELRLKMTLENKSDSIFVLTEKCRSSGLNLRRINEAFEFKQFDEQWKLLMSYIFSWDEEMAHTLLKNVLSTSEETDIPSLRYFIERLFHSINKHFTNVGIMCNRFCDVQSSVNSMDKREELIQFALRRISEIITDIKNNLGGSENMVIVKAKEYINSNYNLDISLDDVAGHVFLSPAYFSRIFKRRCNENFTEYLLKVRMQNAMELLRNTQLKVYDIANAVGYKTLKYFYRLFKQYTGLTPTEFRMSALQDKGDEKCME